VLRRDPFSARHSVDSTLEGGHTMDVIVRFRAIAVVIALKVVV
jgi:hypothetical protein